MDKISLVPKANELLNFVFFCLLTGHGQLTSALVSLGNWLYERSRDEGLKFHSKGHPVWENSAYGSLLEKIAFFFRSFAEHGTATGFVLSYIAVATLSVTFFVLSYARQQRLLPAVASAFIGVLIGFLQAWLLNRQAQWGQEFFPWLYAGAATALILIVVLGIVLYRHFVPLS